MAINAVCPDCRAEYTLADQQRGKKVRCKHCDSIFVVGAAPGKKAEAPVVEVVERPAAKPRPAAIAPKRTKPTRVTRDDEDEDDDEMDVRKPTRGKGKQGGSALPWILGIGGGLLVLVAIGTIVLLVALKDDGSAPEVVSSGERPTIANQGVLPRIGGGQPFQPGGNPVIGPPIAPPITGKPVEGKPIDPPANPTKTEVKPPPPPAEEENDKEAGKGPLSKARKDRVKRATVYLRVTEANGQVGSGSGFFGSVDSPSLILTNAHVVGMKTPESSRPRRIQVFVNSGEADEWQTEARVLGVDRTSDLAVLDIGTPPAGKALPKALLVKSTAKLEALDDVYVFGFPLGEGLGKEITIRKTAVSSVRKNKMSSVPERIEVHASMDPGNSGGPVVDNTGTVVGVAVAIIIAQGRTTQISFAIPGDRVQMILNGRIGDLDVEQPYFAAGDRVAVPVFVEMIDPRHRVKEVALEVWTGDSPGPGKEKEAHRPASTSQPAPQEGDSPRLLFKLNYVGGEGRGDIVLPDLPAGKSYWQQSKWVSVNGETHWGEAGLLKLPGDPVKRVPANLVLHLTPNAVRNVNLTIDTDLKVRNNDDTAVSSIHTEATFREKVRGASQLSLQYLTVKSEDIDSRGRKSVRGKFTQIKDSLPRLVTRLQLDAVGNVINQELDPSALRGVSPQQYNDMKGFHEMIQQGFETLSVSLPAQGSINPGGSWKAERHLPIDTPGKTETGKLDMTCIYLGVRKNRGRDEAVIHVEGVVRSEREVGEAVGGRAFGTVLVDLASGQTRQADVTVLLELSAVAIKLEDREAIKIKLISLMKMKLERKL
jgi:predicted Zn finger-like uncharacterized protein